MLFLVVDRMINYQRIWLKFFQLLVQRLLFYIPYKICTHSLISIDFMVSVCQLFDKPPYVRTSFPEAYDFLFIIFKVFPAATFAAFYLRYYKLAL